MNKRNIIIALLILAALLIFPFRAQLRQVFFGGGTGCGPEIVRTASFPQNTFTNL